MKQINLFLITLLFFSLLSCKSTKETIADTNPSQLEKTDAPPPRGGQMELANDAALLSKLNLTGAQKPRFEEISAKYGKKRRAIMEANEGDRQAMMEAMRSTRMAQNDELKKLLTEKQFEVYTQHMRQQRQQRPGGPGGRRPGGGRN